jgi:hypothetical protein
MQFFISSSLLKGYKNNTKRLQKFSVRCGVSGAVTMKNAAFWDVKPQFIPHRRYIMSPLQSPAS